MKYLLLILLLVGGCCPSRINGLTRLEIASSAPDHVEAHIERIAMLELYDDETDTLYAVDVSKRTPRIVQVYPHWNHKQ